MKTCRPTKRQFKGPKLLTGEFTPSDFSEVIAHLPEACPLVGGQAVAWWASKYKVKLDSKSQETIITSSDIDFWGTRADLTQLAKALGRTAVFPHEYEMTVWAGAIPLKIAGKDSLAEFLHSIPGLDTHDPERACFRQVYSVKGLDKIIMVLSPVSLLYAKLHCLRNFDQTGRSDELHLRVCLHACQGFLQQIAGDGQIRMALWNIERIISAHQFKAYARLEKELGFNILDAVPVDKLKRYVDSSALTGEEKKRLRNFLEMRWPSVS